MKVEINSKRWLDVTSLPGEEWRVIHDSQEYGKYEVSNYGRVKRFAFSGGRYRWPDMIFRVHLSREDGYFRVRVAGKMCAVHRLVAEAFLPNLKNYPEVDHINRIRTDNRVDNLRWASHEINMQNSRRGRAVERIDVLGRIVKQWESIISAAKASGVSRAVMRSAIEKQGWIGIYRYRFA